MKNIIYIILSLVFIFSTNTSFAQKRASDINIDANQSKDSTYIMLTEKNPGKYRQGKGKFFNYLTWRDHLIDTIQYYGGIAGDNIANSDLISNDDHTLDCDDNDLTIDNLSGNGCGTGFTIRGSDNSKYLRFHYDCDASVWNWQNFVDHIYNNADQSVETQTGFIENITNDYIYDNVGTYRTTDAYGYINDISRNSTVEFNSNYDHADSTSYLYLNKENATLYADEQIAIQAQDYVNIACDTGTVYLIGQSLNNSSSLLLDHNAELNSHGYTEINSDNPITLSTPDTINLNAYTTRVSGYLDVQGGSNIGIDNVLAIQNELTTNREINTKAYTFEIGDINGDFDGIKFAVYPTVGVYITNSNQNLNYGINTQTPSVALDVVGDVKASSKINATSLPVYADEAAAIIGGLSTGDIYRTTTGELRIKL